MASPGNRAASLLGATLGRYEVKALIGRGAQGTVYLARDVVLNRNVALKVLLGNAAQEPEVVQAFHREAQTAAGLRHPGIVRVYSAGVQDGIPYIAMEYVAGEPLDRFIKRHQRVGWVSALYIASQVADALDCAHRSGVVHRDVKPGNILLDREGKTHLTDFGIARATHAGNVTGPGGFAGTLHYTSPEQCSGGPVGPASDLYSLGVTLYRLIRGELPFDSDSPVVLIKKITTETAPRLNKSMPEVPDDVARLVAHLMEKQPRSRPADGRAVVERIERIQSEGGGRSVIAEALAAYVKEQAETPQTPTPAPLRPNTPRPAVARRVKRTGLKAMRAKWRVFGSRALWGSALALAGCIAVAAGGWFLSSTVRTSSGAPVLSEAVFEEPAPGVTLVQLPYDGYRLSQVSWVGERPVILVRAEGVEGSLMDGAGGIVAVDVESRKVWSVIAPTGPAVDADYWDSRVSAPELHSALASRMSSDLSESLLLPIRESRGGEPSPYLLLVAQRWDERRPQADALFRMPLDAWTGRCGKGQTAFSAGYAVPSPDGKKVCMVLNDRVHESNYLVERLLDETRVDQTGSPLTTMEEPVVPASTQYSPDGSRITYMRAVDAERRELWTVRSNGNEVNGKLLAAGAFENEYAFAPDGERLAVAERVPGSGEQEVRVLSAFDGATLTRLGPGAVGNAAWNESGEWLVALAADSDGEGKQLWLVDAEGTQSRRALTQLRDGVRTAGAVSRTGRWVAAVAETQGFPALVIVDMEAQKSSPERVQVAKAER